MRKVDRASRGALGTGITLQLGRLELRISFLIALCVLMACALFINLGLWQLGRADEKRQLQRDYALQQEAAPVPLASLPPATGNVGTDAALADRRVLLQGEYLNDASFVLVFQFLQGLPGNEIITPFRQTNGQLILVSRGWMPPSGETALVIPSVPGEQHLTGQLHIPTVATSAGQVEAGEWPVRVRRLHIPQAEQLFGEPLYPWVVRLDAGTPGVLTRHWLPLTVDTRSNLAYALQWFGFAGATLLISLLLSSNLLHLLRRGVP